MTPLRVTPSVVTQLVGDRVSVEEALTRIADKMGEQQEQITNRISELARAAHIEVGSIINPLTVSFFHNHRFF